MNIYNSFMQDLSFWLEYFEKFWKTHALNRFWTPQLFRMGQVATFGIQISNTETLVLASKPNNE